ncbi:MAG: DNA alkylation repair protein [Rhizobiaceae bacterium]
MDTLSPVSTAAEIIRHLKSIGSEENRQGMKRYGIRIDRALGITHGVQRDIARRIKRNHERAFELWNSGITEAQFIASLTADPNQFTANDARRWAAEFDSWDIVDGVADLFANCEAWRSLIDEFAADEREFVRRAAFAMMAWATVHRKKEPDSTIAGFLPLIRQHAADPRNFVWKAVSWALRSIGKRSMELNKSATDLAHELAGSPDKTTRRISKDALRELTAQKTRDAIEKREANRAKKAR